VTEAPFPKGSRFSLGGLFGGEPRLTGIREGLDIVASSNITIARNRIGPFHPSPGDRADGIQFWTTGQTIASRDVLIENNLIVSGPEGRSQGILAGDELGLYKTGAGYARITVRGNVLVGTGWHGISFTAPTEGLTIEGNTLLRIDGADAVKSKWIKAVSGLVVNNRAARFDLAVGVDQAGNVTADASADPAQAAAVVAAWSAVNRAEIAPPPPDPVPMPPVTPPTTSKALERAQKARLEVNDLKNTAARALYAIDQLIAEFSGAK
jgi:hypothetical protein